MTEPHALPQSLAVLGSTGSVGVQALDVARQRISQCRSHVTCSIAVFRKVHNIHVSFDITAKIGTAGVLER